MSTHFIEEMLSSTPFAESTVPSLQTIEQSVSTTKVAVNTSTKKLQSTISTSMNNLTTINLPTTKDIQVTNIFSTEKENYNRTTFDVTISQTLNTETTTSLPITNATKSKKLEPTTNENHTEQTTQSEANVTQQSSISQHLTETLTSKLISSNFSKSTTQITKLTTNYKDTTSTERIDDNNITSTTVENKKTTDLESTFNPHTKQKAEIITTSQTKSTFSPSNNKTESPIEFTKAPITMFISKTNKTTINTANITENLEFTTVLPISETTPTISPEFKVKVANLLNKLKEELLKLRTMSTITLSESTLKPSTTQEINENHKVNVDHIITAEANDKVPLVASKESTLQQIHEYEKARALINSLKKKLEQLKSQGNSEILKNNNDENLTDTTSQTTLSRTEASLLTEKINHDTSILTTLKQPSPTTLVTTLTSKNTTPDSDEKKSNTFSLSTLLSSNSDTTLTVYSTEKSITTKSLILSTSPPIATLDKSFSLLSTTELVTTLNQSEKSVLTDKSTMLSSAATFTPTLNKASTSVINETVSLVQTTPSSIFTTINKTVNKMLAEFNESKISEEFTQTTKDVKLKSSTSTPITTKIINIKNKKEEFIIDGENEETESFETIKITPTTQKPSSLKTTTEKVLITKSTELPKITEITKTSESSSSEENEDKIATDYPKPPIMITTKNWKTAELNFAFVTEAPEEVTTNVSLKSTIVKEIIPENIIPKTETTTETHLITPVIKQENTVTFNLASKPLTSNFSVLTKKKTTETQQVDFNHEQVASSTLQTNANSFSALFPLFKATTQSSIQRLFKQKTFDESQRKTRILLLPPLVQNSIDNTPIKLNHQNQQKIEEKAQIFSEQQHKISLEQQKLLEQQRLQEQQLLIEQRRLQEQQKLILEQQKIQEEQKRFKEQQLIQQQRIFEEQEKIKAEQNLQENQNNEERQLNSEKDKTKNDQTNLKALEGNLANRLEQVLF